MQNLESIVEQTCAKKSGNGGFVGHCPIHDDKNPSLSIKEVDGKVLVHCHAGCPQNELIDYFAEDLWIISDDDERDDMTNCSDALVDEVIEMNEKDTRDAEMEENYTEDAIFEMWYGAYELKPFDPASKYLKSRGLEVNSQLKNLKYLPSCKYIESHTTKIFPALIASIQNSSGERVGLQRIYLDKEGNKAIVSNQKKIIGEIQGGYVELNNDSTKEVTHLAEGIETGLAIFNTFKQRTICSLSATNLSKALTDETSKMKIIHIWADKDKSGTGLNEALKAANVYESLGLKVYVHLPDDQIEDEKKSLDYLDIYIKYGPTVITEQFNKNNAVNMPRPIEFPRRQLPNVNETYLPNVVWLWARSHAQMMNVAPEMILAPFFSAVGSLIGPRLRIKLKRHDDWSEIPNLWGMIIGDPGTRKTSCCNLTIKIIERYEESLRNAALLQIEANRSEITYLESRNQGILAELKKQKAEESTELKVELDENLKKIDNLSCVYPRYIAISTTVESIMNVLSKNMNGILLFRDELSGLFQTFTKKGREEDRPYYLHAWNGYDSYKHETVSRGLVFVPRNCVTVFGGIQPELLNGLVRKTFNEVGTNDGLLQRFQLCVYPDSIKRVFTDNLQNALYDDQISKLIQLVIEMKTSVTSIEEPFATVSLNQEAYQLSCSYIEYLYEVTDKEDDAGMSSHLMKYEKMFGGLCLIFHVLHKLLGEEKSELVTAKSVEMAIKWSKLFEAHARKIYDWDSNRDSSPTYELALKIKNQKWKS